MEDKKIISFRISQELARQLKIKLAEKGETQQDVFEQFTQQYVNAR